MPALDAAETKPIARFWSAAPGWPIVHLETDDAMPTGPDHALGIGRIVLLDPAGHPFCLTDAEAWG